AVGMVSGGQLAKRFADLVGRGVPGHAEVGIVIPVHRQTFSLLTRGEGCNSRATLSPWGLLARAAKMAPFHRPEKDAPFNSLLSVTYIRVRQPRSGTEFAICKGVDGWYERRSICSD